MPYPDKLLADDEEVVAHLHPSAVAAFWPVVRLLLVVGAASFAAALAPAGDLQRPLRGVVAGTAVLLVAFSVVGPLLRWRTTHYVITTSRLLHRSGVLGRRGRDVALARITDVTSSQTLWERVIRAGTLAVASAGESATVLHRVPRIERVQTLLSHMIEEDAGRRDQDGWGSWSVPAGWGAGEHGAADFETNPVG